MEAQDEWIGMNAECPSCQTAFLIKKEQTPQTPDLRVKLNHKKASPAKFLVGKSVQGVKLNHRKVQQTKTESISDRIFYTPPEKHKNAPAASFASDSSARETQCPKCRENVPRAAIFCPSCHSPLKSVKNKDVENSEVSPEMAGNDLKADEKYCSKCGEVIKRAAIYCRFCNSDLQNASKSKTTGYPSRGMTSPVTRISATPYNSNSSRKKNTTGLILGMTAVFILFVVVTICVLDSYNKRIEEEKATAARIAKEKRFAEEKKQNSVLNVEYAIYTKKGKVIPAKVSLYVIKKTEANSKQLDELKELLKQVIVTQEKLDKLDSEFKMLESRTSQSVDASISIMTETIAVTNKRFAMRVELLQAIKAFSPKLNYFSGAPSYTFYEGKYSLQDFAEGNYVIASVWNYGDIEFVSIRDISKKANQSLTVSFSNENPDVWIRENS